MAAWRKNLLVATKLVALPVGHTTERSFKVDGHRAMTGHSSTACEGLEGLRRLQRGLEVILGGRHRFSDLRMLGDFGALRG